MVSKHENHKRKRYDLDTDTHTHTHHKVDESLFGTESTVPVVLRLSCMHVSKCGALLEGMELTLHTWLCQGRG